LNVLSVVSSQVSALQQALRQQLSMIDFMGQSIRVLATLGIFVTYNPGYAGRSELPDALKILFRPCLLTTPDMSIVCENMMMSVGLLSAKRLAAKLILFHKLAAEMLSRQPHYDWGMRSWKRILDAAGDQKLVNAHCSEEIDILARALRNYHVSKIAAVDKRAFDQLVRDIFPGVGNFDHAVNSALEKSLLSVIPALGLQSSASFVKKCLELADALSIRRQSVIVIGPADSGKSCIWKVTWLLLQSI
jgi:dynein heavy chain, axonemal